MPRVVRLRSNRIDTADEDSDDSNGEDCATAAATAAAHVAAVRAWNPAMHTSMSEAKAEAAVIARASLKAVKAAKKEDRALKADEAPSPVGPIMAGFVLAALTTGASFAWYWTLLEKYRRVHPGGDEYPISFAIYLTALMFILIVIFSATGVLRA